MARLNELLRNLFNWILGRDEHPVLADQRLAPVLGAVHRRLEADIVRTLDGSLSAPNRLEVYLCSDEYRSLNQLIRIQDQLSAAASHFARGHGLVDADVVVVLRAENVAQRPRPGAPIVNAFYLKDPRRPSAPMSRPTVLPWKSGSAGT